MHSPVVVAGHRPRSARMASSNRRTSRRERSARGVSGVCGEDDFAAMGFLSQLDGTPGSERPAQDLGKESSRLQRGGAAPEVVRRRLARRLANAGVRGYAGRGLEAPRGTESSVMNVPGSGSSSVRTSGAGQRFGRRAHGSDGSGRGGEVRLGRRHRAGDRRSRQRPGDAPRRHQRGAEERPGGDPNRRQGNRRAEPQPSSRAGDGLPPWPASTGWSAAASSRIRSSG